MQHISGVENKVADTLSILLSTNVNRDEPNTNRDISQYNKLLSTRVLKIIGGGCPLDLALVHQEQKKLRNRNIKLSAYMRDRRYGYLQQ